MSLYDALPLTFPRRKTRPVRVGKITIGGDNPVVVQSMITAETHRVDDCVRQIVEMHRKGAEIVRVTTPSMRDAHCLGQIKEKLRARLVDVPLVADVHHQGSDIAATVAEFVDKVRINPGLFVFHKHTGRTEFTDAEHDEQRAAIEESLLPVITVCKHRDIALRVGVNHGSLAERMLVTYGDTPEGMVQSALEYLRLCRKHGFENIVISLKASRVPIMLAANRLMVQRMDAEGMDYPLHLGVTEAGDGQYARVKSTAGIATLLAEGIGDTIRVSLSEDPVNELPVCYEILQALGLRKTQVEFIACPSCGRTKFDLPTVLNQVKAATGHLVGLDIAVMGCFPPGETVVTEDGFAPIETVQVGQKVLTREGDLYAVTATDAHDFSGELVEIRFRGAPPIRVTPNHPILAVAEGAAEPLWFASEEITAAHTLLYPVLQDGGGAALGGDLLAETMDKAGSNLSLTTPSPHLAYRFHQGLLRQGIAASLTRTDDGYEVARDEGLALDERYLYLPVLSVDRVPYAGPVHNFEVAGSGTYVASLAVVHNCIVNGPGEMADADYGYVGKAGGKITLYRKREELKTVDQSVGVQELIALIKADGKWQEPKPTG